MAIASQVSRISYSGDGVSVSFGIPFYFIRPGDLKVYLRGNGGGESLLREGSDYQVEGAGNYSGGVVTLSRPPAAGSSLVVKRDPPIVQETDYLANGIFPAETHEAALDYLTMICQGLQEQLERTLSFSLSSPESERFSATEYLEQVRRFHTDTAAARDIALAAVSGEIVAQDRNAVLNDAVKALITGTAVGTEGRWRLAAVESVTPTSFNFMNDGAGNRTGVIDTNVSLPAFGYSGWIDPRIRGVIFGDSGSGYEVFNIVGCNVRIHPKHGDVRADFTAGITYPVFVFQESPEPVDQMTGDLEVTEYFLGSGRCDAAGVQNIIGGVGSEAVVNVGYWKGKDWQSQLLGDAKSLANNHLGLKLSRKNRGIWGVEFLDASGGWVDGIRSVEWDSTVLGYTQYLVGNEILLNVAQSYAALGYASEPDMIAHSAVRVKYTTKARMLRPRDFTNGVVSYESGVRMIQSEDIAKGGQVVVDALGNVPVASGDWHHKVGLWRSVWNISTPTDGISYHVPEGHPRYTILPAAGFFFVLFAEGDTYKVGVLFKELALGDAGGHDWGDDGRIPIASNIITTTDDNGNVVLTGCMEYDTGVPVVEA